jgi:hypothetical protein
MTSGQGGEGPQVYKLKANEPLKGDGRAPAERERSASGAAPTQDAQEATKDRRSSRAYVGNENGELGEQRENVRGRKVGRSEVRKEKKRKKRLHTPIV